VSGLFIAVVVIGGGFILHKMSMNGAGKEELIPAKDTVGRV